MFDEFMYLASAGGTSESARQLMDIAKYFNVLSKRKITLLACHLICNRVRLLNFVRDPNLITEHIAQIIAWADGAPPPPRPVRVIRGGTTFISTIRLLAMHQEGSVSSGRNALHDLRRITHRDASVLFGDEFRHFMGNPYRPWWPHQAPPKWAKYSLGHAWYSTYNGGRKRPIWPRFLPQLPSTVVQLAQSQYAGVDCSFALHDALLEADLPELANHFTTAEHPKGCWVLDVLLGKE